MHGRQLRYILAGAMLFASTALAEPASHHVSVGLGGLRYYSIFRYSELVATLEASYQRAAGQEGLWRSVYLGGGLRFAVPTGSTYFPLEGFVRAELRARMGFWEPAMGIELGASRIPRLTWRLVIPLEVIAREDERVGPLYGAVHLAPLRFRVAGLVLGGPEVQVGAVGPPFGGTTRLQVGLLKVEVSL